MIMLIDTLAHRYGMLPSEVMHKANTFDMFICDTAISYRHKVNQDAIDKNKPVESYTQEELLEMVAQARGQS